MTKREESHLNTASSISHGMFVAATEKCRNSNCKGLNLTRTWCHHTKQRRIAKSLLMSRRSPAVVVAPSTCVMNSVFSRRDASCSFSCGKRQHKDISIQCAVGFCLGNSTELRNKTPRPRKSNLHQQPHSHIQRHTTPNTQGR